MFWFEGKERETGKYQEDIRVRPGPARVEKGEDTPKGMGGKHK